MPTSWDSELAPKPPSNEPTLGPTWPNTALSAAIVRSQTTCSTWPPPMAQPATMATIGFGQRRICTCRSVTWKRPVAFSSVWYPLSPRTRWSPPEQNALSPWPVRMMTPTDSSSRATVRAAEISIRVCGRKALCTSGRQIVILAMPSSVVS